MLGISSPIAMSERERATLKLAAGFTFYWLVCLRLDAQSTAITQAFIGLTTWTFVAVVLRFSPWEERIQVLTIIGVATFFECLFSLIWGAYEYRLGNLPIYVPAGHGLFYYTALRLAELSFLRRHSRLVVLCVFMGSAALLARNLWSAPLSEISDMLGLVTWVIFIPFILRERFALLYAVSFTMTMALEFYGTSLGVWTWAPILPWLRLSVANPPACVGAGYCIFDAITRWLAPRAHGVLRRKLSATQVKSERWRKNYS